LAKQKQRKFTAYMRVNVEVGYDIMALNIEEATEKAKKLDVTDVIDINGEYCDSNIFIRGVYDDWRTSGVNVGVPEK
jgi:hypothetical protein